MKSACQDACDLASWPARERIRASKRIIPRRKVEGVLRDCGLGDRGCGRVPGWFLVWFVVALGLFCRDSYRQVFRWLSPYRRHGTDGILARDHRVHVITIPSGQAAERNTAC